MRRLHPDGGYSLAGNLANSFANLGYWITPETRILDYGCGTGALVYEFRDLGFDAYGFDLHERVAYRSPDDHRFFGFFEGAAADHSDQTFDPEKFKLPWPDETFDIVLSTSVIEHVLELRPMIGEIHRTLKPSGFSWHLFPRKSIVIEPHIYVPFASRFQSWLYFYFWAALGVRNEYQNHMTARQAADNNVLYCKTGLRYRTDAEIFSVCAEFFTSFGIEWPTWFHYATEIPAVRRAAQRRALAAWSLSACAQTQRLGVLQLSGKR